jgi:CheY-specific phosphatase CheX
MISERAKSLMNTMLIQGMRSALLRPEDEVVSLGEVSSIEPVSEKEMVMLSVASYEFRLLIMIYFDRDAATLGHFAGKTRMSAEAMDHQMFDDAISECGNLCCGTFNRELGRAFTHIGMSTPNIIDSRCAEHLTLLKYGHLQHFELLLQSGVRFRLSMCVCEYKDLDFELEAPAGTENTGELEFL